MSKFYILPTTDIHLVLDSAITSGRQFVLKFYYSGGKDIFTPSLISKEVEDETIIQVDINYDENDENKEVEVIVNAKQKVGVTFIRIRYDEGQESGQASGQKFQECYIRVWVHKQIEKMWISNNHLTIYRGESFHGYVPSVFAKFKDTDDINNTFAQIGDITYHPYLQYEEENGATNLTVNNHIIKAPNVNTLIETELKIGIEGNNINMNDKVNVTIKEPYDTKREILQKIHRGKSDGEHINLLILGDGFMSYANFRVFLNQTVDVLLNNNIMSPWNLLKDRLTIWAACEPTINDKEGITINFPVNQEGMYIPNYEGNRVQPSFEHLSLTKLIDEIGLPDYSSPKTYADANNHWHDISHSNLDEAIFDDWLYYNTIKGYVENKDSVLGIKMGNRLGDKIGSHFTNAFKMPTNDWYYHSDKQRYLDFDRRRYPEDKENNPKEQHLPSNSVSSTFYTSSQQLADASPIDKYLGTLKYIDTSNGVPKPPGNDYDIGKTWQAFSKDAGNVMIISNHYKGSGTNISVTYLLNGTYNVKVSWSAFTLLTEKALDISPTTENKLEDNVSVLNAIGGVDKIRLAGLLGHEFMHSIFIEDEYEGRGSDPDSDTDEAPNLSTIYHLAKREDTEDDKIINPKKIKWNLRRVALSSMVLGNVTMSGNILTVKLEAGQTVKWQKVLANKLPLYIRSSRFQPNTEIVFYERAINEITEIESGTDTIKLKLEEDLNLGDPNLTLLNRGCHIYLPKRLNDDFINIKENPELFIINPRVFQHLINTEKPFSEKTSCIESQRPSYPPSDSDINQNSDVPNANQNDPPPNYPLFSSPNNRFLISGVYEGGGLHNCKVYRPSGWSLMRLHGLTKSYVSQMLQNGENIVSDIEKPKNLGDNAIYSRFDFFSKYFFIARFYPTLLEDLDRSEYKYYDSTIL